MSTTHSDLRKTFMKPPFGYAPMPAWWWSGERLTAERLEWQLKQLKAGGIESVVIFSLAPGAPRRRQRGRGRGLDTEAGDMLSFPSAAEEKYWGSPQDEPSWFSDEWWELFAHVCSVAQTLGMSLWFYDHLGFGQLRVPLRLIEQRPRFASRELCRQELKQPMPDQANILAEIGGFRYYTAPVSNRKRGWYSPDVYDVMQGEAGAALIDAIHGEFERRLPEHIGTVIKGSFQDELHRLSTWTPALAEAFEARAGQSFLESLPALFECERASGPLRLAYHETLAALAEEAFFRPLHDWHEARGMLVACDQMDRARAADPFASSDIYHDYPRTHRWFSAPGNDHNGEAKVHSSLAHLYGRPRVFFEAFHSSGWGGTLEDTFRWLAPWFRQGVTLFHPHAVFYGAKGSWWEWAPPSTCWRQPYWRHYPKFAKAVARISWLLSQGRHVCDVGVVYPAATMQADLPLPSPTRQGSGWPISWRWPSERSRRCDEVFWRLVGNVGWRWHGSEYRDDSVEKEGLLASAGYDFDVIDEASLGRGSVAERRLHIAEEDYGLLVFPAVTCLSRKSLRVAEELLERGGHVAFVGCFPDTTTEGGYKDRELEVFLGRHAQMALRDVEELDGPHRLDFENGGSLLIGREMVALEEWLAQRLERRIRGKARFLERRVGEAEVYFIDPLPHLPPPWEREDRLARFARELGEPDPKDFLRAEPIPETLEVTLRSEKMMIQLDPFTGGATRPKILGRIGDSVRLEVDLTQSPVALLVAEEGLGAVSTQPCLAKDLVQEQMLLGAWECELRPTFQNQFGDHRWPPSDSLRPVEARRLKVTASPDKELVGKTVLASFGRYVELSGPHPAGQGPDEGVARIADWRPAAYSEKYGMEADSHFWRMLGPKGAPLPDFLDFGEIGVDETCFLRTSLVSDRAQKVKLRIGGRVISTSASGGDGAELTVRVWLNGKTVGSLSVEASKWQPEGYSHDGYEGTCLDVELQRGPNELRMSWKPLRPGRMRGYFHLLSPNRAAPYPHPLRNAGWLESGAPPQAPELVRIDPHPEWAGSLERFEVLVPPGATKVYLNTEEDARLWLDGESIENVNGAAALPRNRDLVRKLIIEVARAAGRMGGSQFSAPLEFDVGSGQLELGAWAEQGLPHYSGGVLYKRALNLQEARGRVLLDLGEVRGSAEVWLNGKDCGTRIWHPYRFDLSEAAVRGDNELVIEVYNTLGPYYGDGHPSPYVFEGQASTGLIGPVRLLGIGAVSG